MSLTAVYNYPDRGYRPATQLEVGKEYHVERVNMGQSSTDIHLSGLGCFNSVHFDFFEDCEPIDIYRSPKYNPYMMKRAKEVRLDPTNAVIVSNDTRDIIHNGVHHRCPHCGSALMNNRGAVPIWNVGAVGKWECCKCRKQYKTITLSVPVDTSPEAFYERICKALLEEN